MKQTSSYAHAHPTLRFGQAQLQRYKTYYAKKYAKHGLSAGDSAAKFVSPTSPLTVPERSSFLRCSMDLCELKVHKQSSLQQNKAYTRDTDAAVAGEDGVAVVILDYKANVRTGVKRRETDQAYYGRSCATVLGLAIWLPGAKTPVYVDSVSRNLRHTSAVAETVVANAFEASAQGAWAGCLPCHRGESEGRHHLYA